MKFSLSILVVEEFDFCMVTISFLSLGKLLRIDQVGQFHVNWISHLNVPPRVSLRHWHH